jgi:hypothetical protein
VAIFDGGGLRVEAEVRLEALGAVFPVGVLAPDDKTCCRDVLPLAVEYLLKVEGELERVDTGLPWPEASFILRANRGRREVGDAGDVGEIGESTSCLSAP